MNRTKKEVEEWKEYRLSILEQKSKSEDDFEKYITFIASGGLGLTLTFIDKIVSVKESICKWTLIVGWFCLAMTLFVNLLSHYLASKHNSKTIQEIDDDLPYEDLVTNIDKRNGLVSKLNLLTIFSLGIGIVFILIFVTINLYHG